MTKQEMNEVMEEIFDFCRSVMEVGHNEYAHGEDNVFSSFEKLDSDLEISRERVLLTYFKKHYDGVCSYVKGYKSQREDVRGRIIDMIVYLCLLYGMVEQDNGKKDNFVISSTVSEE